MYNEKSLNAHKTFKKSTIFTFFHDANLERDHISDSI